MSDSVKKWHEMQEENSTPIVFQKKLSEEQRKEAYKVLAYYDAEVIRYAANILDSE